MKSLSPTAFIPHPLARGGHLQTLVAHFGRGPQGGAHEFAFEVPVSDGDALVVHVNEPVSEPFRDPHAAPSSQTLSDKTLVVLHGLSGCSMSLYAQHLAVKLPRQGIRVVRINHRGCGPSAQTSKGIYHAGSSADIHEVITWVARRWPNTQVFVAGFSLSGNMLLNWASREEFVTRHPSNLAAVMAVSAPVQLEECSQALSSWSNVHFDQYFTRRLISTAQKRQQWPSKVVRPDGTSPGWMTLREFDEIFTATRAGFKDRNDYYQKASAYSHLPNVACPAVILAAADDPFIPARSYDGVKWPRETRLWFQDSGGHVGFIGRDKTPFGDLRWMDAVIAQWVASS